jgi:hypothetical protein
VQIFMYYLIMDPFKYSVSLIFVTMVWIVMECCMAGYFSLTVHLVHQTSDCLQNFLSLFHLLFYSNCIGFMRWRLMLRIGAQFM